MECNGHRLCGGYFQSLNPQNEEIGNECVSILSMFYLDISDLFSFYAALQPQIFNQKDNELITLQGFQHFCKLVIITAKASVQIDKHKGRIWRTLLPYGTHHCKTNDSNH